MRFFPSFKVFKVSKDKGLDSSQAKAKRPVTKPDKYKHVPFCTRKGNDSHGNAT